MKEEILKRAMFAMPLSKEARNSGIMAGFDLDEMEEGSQENSALEELPPMARTPQNPEILMNNLRGDFRSVDARYMELAQMVGEDAAMETPPEVLAMLQPQLAAQQAPQGIGALPQAQGMMPPGGAMPPSADVGMAMPQGGIPMPQGMESAAPFSQGAEAPPTPDGMPPVRAAVGAFITPATRAAQFLADKASTYGQAANAAMGRMFMPPTMTQPYLENLRGPGGRYTAEQVVKGGELLYPTFTQGVAQGVTRLADQYPRAAALIPPSLLAAGAVSAPRSGPITIGSEAANQIPTSSGTPYTGEITRNYDISNPDPSKWTVTPTGGAPRPIPVRQPAAPATPAQVFPTDEEALATMTREAQAGDPLGAFIAERLAAADKRDQEKGVATTRKEAVQGKTKMERIKEAAGEYAPLFQEMLGSDKEDAKMNALLLLSEAGLRLAGTRKPTFAMALGEAFSGVPKGFAAIAAQERELGLKIKTAALQQAISDVDAQDKYAQAVRLQVLKGDYELLKEQAKKGGTITEDGGAGLRIVKTKDGGSFVGAGLDPADPTVTSAVQSRFTLRDTDNPFVENRGKAPTTMETDKAERIKLTNTLRSLDNSLATLDNLKGVYTNAYGPGAWFVDKVNNLIVPIDPTGAIKPNFDAADAATRISTGMNSILKNIASANDGGRVAVQEQEWARDTAKGISNPVAFFSDKELAAKQFGSMEAMLRNARQQVLTQLGYEANDYVMRTPSTGTQNDPFIIPTDPQQQKAMFTFLGSTIGKVQDPRATVYLRMPNGKVDAFNPTQLRGLIQQ